LFSVPGERKGNPPGEKRVGWRFLLFSQDEGEGREGGPGEEGQRERELGLISFRMRKRKRRKEKEKKGTPSGALIATISIRKGRREKKKKRRPAFVRFDQEAEGKSGLERGGEKEGGTREPTSSSLRGERRSRKKEGEEKEGGKEGSFLPGVKEGGREGRGKRHRCASSLLPLPKEHEEKEEKGGTRSHSSLNEKLGGRKGTNDVTRSGYNKIRGVTRTRRRVNHQRKLRGKERGEKRKRIVKNPYPLFSHRKHSEKGRRKAHS